MIIVLLIYLRYIKILADERRHFNKPGGLIRKIKRNKILELEK
jgi:hypothetical protein